MIERLIEFARVNGFIFNHWPHPEIMDSTTLYFRNPMNDRKYSTRLDPVQLYSVDPQVLITDIEEKVTKELLH